MENLLESHQWLSLLPPILAIGLALATRQVFLSLAAGIWLGFVILANGNPLTGTFVAIDGAVAVFSDAGNTRVIIFTLLVGALIALIQRSGGVEGFVQRLLMWLEGLSTKANGRGQRKIVEILAVLTGLLLFIESNISILTVGTVYRPIFDKLGIPREKLAYITDSTASPSCILIPFNAWGAFITGLIAAQGIANPFGTLLAATAVNFYPMLVLAILVFVILSGKDVGEMRAAERRAAATGALVRDGAQLMMEGGASAVEIKPDTTARARFMLLPIIAMVVLMPSFLIMTGEGSGALERLQSGSGSKSVLYATSFAVLFAMILYKFSGVMKIRESFTQSLSGMGAMVPLAILMVLAFTLGALCRELGTGQYVADVAKQFISPALVPAMIFLVACFVAFSTGTSWGTFAIMIAIAVPLAQSMDANISLAIAASLGGGIFGDHCSPTSDTSIITSMATANDHIDHVRTQIPYALIGGGITVGLYLILGLAGV
ncbi:MAG: Na+/H+ antiporter NhaC family protein [Litorimonas sp.]